MPEQIVKIPISQIDPHPDQIRKHFNEDGLLALGQNLRVRQIQPIIVYRDASSDRFVLADGERRWRASLLAKLDVLNAIVLDHMPTSTELYEMQICIAVHSEAVSVVEKSDHLQKIKREKSWTISELADRLSMKQPQVTKLLKFAVASPELRAALQSGLDQDKAYAIASEPDHVKQRELVAVASVYTRQQLRQRAKSTALPAEIKTRIARFPRPKGFLVTIQGPRLSLASAVEVAHETWKDLKKALEDSLDISTTSKVMRDRYQSMK